MSNAEPETGAEPDRPRKWIRFTDAQPCSECDESFHFSLAREYHYLRNHASV